MTRTNTQQPITKNVNDLVIGLLGVRVRKQDSTWSGWDDKDSPLTSTYSIGSIQSGEFTANAAFKIHESGYPKTEDARMLEDNEVMSSIVVEELGSALIQRFLYSIINRAFGATPDSYSVETLLEKVYGSGISVYQNYAQLKPTFTVSSQNDWIGTQFDFESILNSTFTNQDLAYRKNYTGSARNVLNQPKTLDPNALCIGFAQVRMGDIVPRASSTAAIYRPRIYPGRSILGQSDSTAIGTAAQANDGTAYTGALDGAYVCVCTTTRYRLESTVSGTTFNVSDTGVSFSVDGGGAIACTITSGATVPIATVVADINSSLTGATAYASDDNTILVTSDAGPSGTIECTEANTDLGFAIAAVPAADTFTWYDLTGLATTGVAITGAAQALEEAVTVTWAATTGNFWGDTVVIGVKTGDAVTDANGATAVWSRHSYLLNANSVGAVQAATLSLNANMKEHKSGYPQKKDAELAESVEVVVDVSVEEFTFADGYLVVGAATTLADMVFDSSISGSRYFAPVEFLVETLNGGVVTFFLPNAQVVGELSVSPSDDWAVLPLKFAGQQQSESLFHSTTTAPRQLYMYSTNYYSVL